jgi:hypothetical protein
MGYQTPNIDRIAQEGAGDQLALRDARYLSDQTGGKKKRNSIYYRLARAGTILG